MQQLSDEIIGNGRFNQPEANFLDYPWKRGKNIIEMPTVWNLPRFGPFTRTPLRIRVREYEPEDNTINSTESQWKNTNGELVRVRQHPYAVYDTGQLPNDVSAWLSESLPDFYQWLLARSRHDKITELTYREAMRLESNSGPGQLLNCALQIQYYSVISQGYCSVSSDDIPGIKEYDFSRMGHSTYEAYDRNAYDKPVPTAINHQMDVAAVKLLERYEETCKKLLKHHLFQPGSKVPWYYLFLTFFVLICNLEYIHSSAESYIASKRGTVSCVSGTLWATSNSFKHVDGYVNNVVSRQMQSWESTFDVIMYHWVGCLRGFKPFVLARENVEELAGHAGHPPDAEGFQYMATMASLLADRGPSKL